MIVNVPLSSCNFYNFVKLLEKCDKAAILQAGNMHISIADILNAGS